MKQAEKQRTVTVYALSSSRDGEIRYIGQTVGKLYKRLAAHRHSAKVRNTAVACWIRRELADGHAIQIEVVEADALWHLSEIMWIAEYRAAGARLLNLTDGGEGTLGWKGPLGVKRPYLSERNREGKGKPGRPSTPETNAKISAAHQGKKKPWVSELNRSRKGLPGRKHTEESKAKISDKLSRRVFSDEWCRKISESQKKAHERKKLQALALLAEPEAK